MKFIYEYFLVQTNYLRLGEIIMSLWGGPAGFLRFEFLKGTIGRFSQFAFARSPPLDFRHKWKLGFLRHVFFIFGSLEVFYDRFSIRLEGFYVSRFLASAKRFEIDGNCDVATEVCRNLTNIGSNSWLYPSGQGSHHVTCMLNLQCWIYSNDKRELLFKKSIHGDSRDP
jgi:hypothetical protein